MRKNPKKLLPLLWIAVSCILLLLIWPVKAFRLGSYTSESMDRGLVSDIPIGEAENFSYVFSPSYPDLHTIAFLFNNNSYQTVTGTLTLTISDISDEIVYQCDLAISELGNRRITPFPVDLKLDCSKKYKLTLTAKDYGDLPLMFYTGAPDIRCDETVSFDSPFNFTGIVTPYVNFTYRVKPTLRMALPYCIMIVSLSLLGLLSMAVAEHISKKEESGNE